MTTSIVQTKTSRITLLLWALLANVSVTSTLFGGGSKASSSSATETRFYGVIIDAGSSGSRIHVYRWPRRSSIYSLPPYERVLTIKSSGGHKLADYADHLDHVQHHLAPLINGAADFIPEDARSFTSIQVLATAGMRLLEADKAEAVLSKVNSLLSDPRFSPFRYHTRNTRILSGEEEGAFAWLAVNYLMHYFDDPDNQQSMGIVEMGGASTQIAFLPTGSILSDKFDMRIAARHYSLYVHSYLDYGASAASSWIDTHLATVDQPDKDPVTQPCLPTGFSFQCDVPKCGRNVTIAGGSKPAACIAVLEELIYKADYRRCSPKPCAIGSVYQPYISVKMQFLAMSSFFRTLDRLNVLHPDGTFQPSAIYQPAFDLCSKDYATISREHADLADKHRPLICFGSMFTPLLLTKGLGFANDSLQMVSKHTINGMELDWSLGAIIYESERDNWECSITAGASRFHGNGGGVVAHQLRTVAVALVTLVFARLLYASIVSPSGT